MDCIWYLIFYKFGVMHAASQRFVLRKTTFCVFFDHIIIFHHFFELKKTRLDISRKLVSSAKAVMMVPVVDSSLSDSLHLANLQFWIPHPVLALLHCFICFHGNCGHNRQMPSMYQDSIINVVSDFNTVFFKCVFQNLSSPILDALTRPCARALRWFIIQAST